jgi:hypothetical protein
VEGFLSQALAQFTWKFDVVEELAKSNGLTKQEYLAPFAQPREIVQKIQELAPGLSMGLMALVAGLLTLLHLPHLRVGLRWAGLSLLLSGGLVLAVVRVGTPQLLFGLAEFLQQQNGIPTGVFNLAIDLAASSLSEIANAILGPAGIVFVIGLGMTFLSFLLPHHVKENVQRAPNRPARLSSAHANRPH